MYKRPKWYEEPALSMKQADRASDLDEGSNRYLYPRYRSVSRATLLRGLSSRRYP